MNLNSDPIERYLARLNKALHGASPEEKSEILSDIRSLIQEHVEEGRESVDAVLSRLGSAEILADNYRVEGLLVRASASSSPMDMIRAAYSWSMRGLMGFVTAILVFNGYVFGFAFLLVALAKPFLPHNTGLFVGEQVLYGINFGKVPERELLGIWIIPISLVLAWICFTVTHCGARWIMRRRKSLIPSK